MKRPAGQLHLSVTVKRPLIATYRLQLGPELNFARAAELVPYLSKVGVSHLYLSPVLDAAAGSAHGYDVVNHTKISQALGGEEGFARLVAAAHAANIGIVLDLVPNHMSIADARNQWWWDVLENGRSGRWAHASDVDWDPPEPRLKDVVLLPVLGEHLSQVLAAKQVKVAREGAVFTVRYFEHPYPVARRSLGLLLRHATAHCEGQNYHWPHRLNASSTHDSKRSADVRARLLAMSQQPKEFAAFARHFFALTEKLLVDGLPDAKLRMTALQLLVGAWPLSPERLHAALEKSAREAKIKTSWLRPDEKYDAALASFATAVVADDAVRGLIDGFVRLLMPRARAVSLGWVLLKCAGPGVPDFYQGTELWNFSLVDPDNRSPVDWLARAQAIAASTVPPLEEDDVGLTKLFVTRRALALRRERPELFDAKAAYEPLEVTGPQAEAVVAFSRVAHDGSRAVAVVPRWPGKNWESTGVRVPEGQFDSHLDERRGLKQVVPLTSLFAKLPLALLSSRS